MHVDDRIGEIHLQNRFPAHLPPFLVPGIPFNAAVALHIPLGEELHLAREHRPIVGRKHAGARRRLPLDERSCGRVHELSRILFIENVEEGFAPEVRNNGKARFQIHRQDFRHVEPGILHELLHLDEGRKIFMLRRRIHNDVGAAARTRHAEIAPEAGIGTRRSHRLRVKAERRCFSGEPGLERIVTFCHQ